MYTNKHTMQCRVFYKKELLLDFLLFLSSYPLFYYHVKFSNLLVHESLAKLLWCWALLFIPRFITSTSRTSWFFFSFALSLSCTLNSNVFEYFLYQISSPIISTCKFITSSTIINVLTKYISFQVQVLWLYQKQPGRCKIHTHFQLIRFHYNGS